ncbi:fimbria/pilus outer membrane usher protein [Paraburkholderia terrae]|uniref:fimbria/pilus outer membrane usher protein n=1 Tax=Paraburkholderia terrae TaxID=311230 RepID=UPI001EE36319|nr:fimbria/pilus outer membrane usher protein [Paraburkholderia terrae]GJG99193.1 fimbria/pilus outer membrane usher protein [Paraburkholderia terrae]
MPWRRRHAAIYSACTGIAWPLMCAQAWSAPPDASAASASDTTPALSVAAQPMPSSPRAPSTAPIPAAPANGEVYLEVTINGESTKEIAHFVVTDAMIYTTPNELRDVGIRTDDLPPPGKNGLIALGTIPGLRYTYRPEHQQLDLQLTDARRQPATLENIPARPPVSASGTGLVINYEFSAQTNSPTQYGLYSEERFFYPGGLLDNTGTAYWYRNLHRYVRLDTTWSHSNPDTMVTTRVGDTISSSLTWTRPVRLGGAQVSRDFTLRPDLVTYPVPTLAGTSAVPSAVDLYVNNVRQFTGSAPSGPFVINAVPAINGAGEAVIVTRDVLGRSVMTTVPLYIDSRLLAPGLTDFSVEAGFLRRSYALSSFDYAGDPSLSVSFRHGLTSRITLETHGEATRGVYNAGVGALLEAGGAGVLNFAVAGSAGNGGDGSLARNAPATSLSNPTGVPIGIGFVEGTTNTSPGGVLPTPGGSGAQFAAGWQWHLPAISIDLQAQHATPHYSDLASAEGTPVPRTTYRATLALPFRLFGSSSTASASLVGLDDPYYGNSRIGSLAWTTTLPASTSLSASVYHDFGDTGNTGVFVALSFLLGGSMNASVNAGSDHGKPLFGAAVTRTPDYGGGLGWQMQTSRQNGQQQSLAQATWRGRYGDLIGSVANVGSRTYGEVDASGSVVLMAGDVLAGRRIDDAFALVSTDGVPHVPVLHENREIGETNGAGHLLVPDLVAYEPNHLAIDPLGLPADTAVATTRLNLAPQSRAGVLARFPLRDFTGAQLIVVDAAGKPLPAGAVLTQRETGKRYVIGYDGLAFVDDMRAANAFTSTSAQGPCEVDVTFERKGSGLPTLGPFTCKARSP